VTAIAFVAVATLAGAIVALVWLSHQLGKTAGREADARVNVARLEGRLAVALTDVDTQTDRADTEQRRADAFDDLLDQVALTGDATGARARVLARYTRAAKADGLHPGAVSTVPGPAGEPVVDRDGLIRPGE
jgi:hypothetical protein